MTKYRAGSSFIILAAIVFLPYWIYLPLLLAATIVFPFFVEAIFFGLLVDVLYGEGIGSLWELLSPTAFVATCLLVVLLPVRERLRVDF